MINFYGDLIPTNDLKFHEDLAFHESNSINCFNLECAISLNKADEKKGTLIIEPSDVIIPTCSNLLFNLANNHIHDAGERGILDTIDYCIENKISYIGAGRNLAEAQKAFFYGEYAIISFCEKNNSYLKDICEATDVSAGVNVLTLDNVQNTLALLGCYKVIVVLHWSVEHIQTLPYHLKAMLDSITNFKNVISVVGHHPHVPQSEFIYNKVCIYPSLGNLFFPEFVILPPIKSHFTFDSKEISATTYHYHRVKVATLKKWKKINKVSLIVSVFEHGSSMQTVINEGNEVRPIKEPKRIVILRYITKTFSVWGKVYNIIHKTEKQTFYTYWRAYNYLNRNINGLRRFFKGNDE
jgi:hypothetical protein